MRVRTALAVLVTLAAAPSAPAATVDAVTTCGEWWCSTNITVSAGSERNTLHAVLRHTCLPNRCQADGVAFSDTAPLTAGTGCSGGAGTPVLCPVRGSVSVNVTLGDGDDSFSTSTPAIPLWWVDADGGAGDDRLILDVGGRFSGGAGADVLTVTSADGRTVRLNGGEGDDVLDTTRSAAGTNVYASLGGGADTLRAGAGVELVYASGDGRSDVVDCGVTIWELKDEAIVDPFDVVNCERKRVVNPDDKEAPSSTAAAPATSTSPTISVRYSASDPAPSSGIHRVQLWVKSPGDDRFRLDQSSTEADGTFSYNAWAGDGHYAFYTVATDQSGNVEAPPADADATTRLDTTAPAITSVSPRDGATKVNPATSVSVTFSEAMDRSATEEAFRLTGPDGRLVTGSVSWNGATLTFRPGANLSSRTAYAAEVGAQARDEAGVPLGSARAWRFTTR